VVPELATLLRGRQDLLRDIGIAMLPTAPVFAEFDPRAGFEKARQRAHLPWVVLHHLRHTAGSWLGQTGASAFTIAETLGHSDIRTTQRYVHLDDATRRNALETAMKRRGRPTNR
jgi:integrase